MVDADLAEIDSALELPYDAFVALVIQEMRRRFQGISGHSDLLWMALSTNHADLMEIAQQTKRMASQASEIFKDMIPRQWKQFKNDAAYASPSSRSGFLKIMADTANPFVDAIDLIIAGLPPSREPFIISAVRNINDNNIVRLRRLIHVCHVYSKKLEP